MGKAVTVTTHLDIGALYAERHPDHDKPLDKFTPREIGCLGEDVACVYLDDVLEIVERNWRCPFGEADVVCMGDHDTVVLVEVKTRLSLGGAGDLAPEVSVGQRKRERYRRIASSYVATHPRVHTVRFDVVAVIVTGACDAQVHHVTNAFEWDDEPWMR